MKREEKIKTAGSGDECFEEGCAGVTRRDHIGNEEIRRRLQQRLIIDVVS